MPRERYEPVRSVAALDSTKGSKMADLKNLSGDEAALIVAMQGGFEPRAEDPVVKALEARGVARASETDGKAWSLTESGLAYRPD
jgi:hypothetical protein